MNEDIEWTLTPGDGSVKVGGGPVEDGHHSIKRISDANKEEPTSTGLAKRKFGYNSVGNIEVALSPGSGSIEARDSSVEDGFGACQIGNFETKSFFCL